MPRLHGPRLHGRVRWSPAEPGARLYGRQRRGRGPADRPGCLLEQQGWAAAARAASWLPRCAVGPLCTRPLLACICCWSNARSHHPQACGRAGAVHALTWSSHCVSSCLQGSATGASASGPRSHVAWSSSKPSCRRISPVRGLERGVPTFQLLAPLGCRVCHAQPWRTASVLEKGSAQPPQCRARSSLRLNSSSHTQPWPAPSQGRALGPPVWARADGRHDAAAPGGGPPDGRRRGPGHQAERPVRGALRDQGGAG